MKNKKIYLIIIMVLILLGIIIYCKLKINNEPDISKIEHIISIKSTDNEIKAVTGSFCYPNICIDKINFEDFNYEIIPSISNKKLYIDNLDGNINSIELFDNTKKEFLDINIDYTNEYIITPNISGTYIFKISAIYQNKNIEYYFMSNISQTDDLVK